MNTTLKVICSAVAFLSAIALTYVIVSKLSTQTQQVPHMLGPGGTQQPPHMLGPGGTQQHPHMLGPGGTQQPPHMLGPGGTRQH